MKLLNTIFQFYVYSNIHVSISVACLILITGKMFDINTSKESMFMAGATFVAYHLIRYLNRFKYGKKHLLEEFSNQYKTEIKVLLFIVGLSSFYLMVCFELEQLIKLFPFGILTLLYAFGFVNVNGVKYSLRYIPVVKIFVIAFVWAGVSVFFLLDLSAKTLVFFLQMMLFVLALTIPFDIRDLFFDEHQIKTIPVLIGVKKTKIIGIFFMILSVIIHYMFAFSFFNEYLLIAVILALLIMFSSPKQSKFYASFWVEGIPFLWYLLIFCL